VSTVSVQAPAHAAEQGAAGGDPDGRADDARGRPDPPRVVAAGDRAGAQQPAHRQRGEGDHARQRPRLGVAGDEAPFDQGQPDRADHHDEQEDRLLQEVEVGVVEAELNATGRERTGDEARQERPDPHRCGHADPLEDVEDEVHRAVPWRGVTIVEESA
jgi:hypothetical protein